MNFGLKAKILALTAMIGSVCANYTPIYGGGANDLSAALIDFLVGIFAGLAENAGFLVIIIIAGIGFTFAGGVIALLLMWGGKGFGKVRA
jgi:hypothetical protein